MSYAAKLASGKPAGGKPVGGQPVVVTKIYAYPETHSIVIGYVLWIFGFMGLHRFYFGKPLTGILWFFTFGLLGIGWLVDLFLIPGMNDEARHRFHDGAINYSLGWLLLILLGALGIHRFYLGKWVTGILYLLTGGLLGIGVIYDILTLNDQIDQANRPF